MIFFKKNRPQATLKRITPQRILLSIFAVFALIMILEGYKQVRIQLAFADASKGEYQSALETISETGYPWFRRNSIKSLEQEAQFFVELAKGIEFVKKRNWFPAHSSLIKLSEHTSVLEEKPEVLAPFFDAWKTSMNEQLAQGYGLELKTALETLLKIHFPSGPTQQHQKQIGLETSLALIQHFKKKSAWTAVLFEIERAQSLGAKKETTLALKKEIETQLIQAIRQAADQKEFTRAEALTQIHREAFKGSTQAPLPALDKIQLKQSLENAAKLESQEKFEEALLAYDKALENSKGDDLVFEKLSALRQKLLGYKKIKTGWIKSSLVEENGIDADIMKHLHSWKYENLERLHRLYSRNKKSVYMGDYRLNTQLSVRTTEGPRPEWIFTFEFINKGRRTQDSTAEFELGLAILSTSGKALEARRVTVPFLLAGSTNTIEIRLPKSSKDSFMRYGKITTH